MCARRSVQAEAAEACNGLVCETSAKVHFANSDLMCATRSVLQCSNACARATIQSLGGASRQSACACADVALTICTCAACLQNTSRWGHHDHSSKMIIEGAEGLRASPAEPQSACQQCSARSLCKPRQRTEQVTAMPSSCPHPHTQHQQPHGGLCRRILELQRPAHVRDSRGAAAARRKF